MFRRKSGRRKDTQQAAKPSQAAGTGTFVRPEATKAANQGQQLNGVSMPFDAESLVSLQSHYSNNLRQRHAADSNTPLPVPTSIADDYSDDIPEMSHSDRINRMLQVPDADMDVPESFELTGSPLFYSIDNPPPSTRPSKAGSRLRSPVPPAAPLSRWNWIKQQFGTCF